MALPMSAQRFVNKWKGISLTERAVAHQHFVDLCDLLDHPRPAEVDATGESFTFEKGAAKMDGGKGWADVWKRGFFAWEYKGRGKDLNPAYRQLQQYRDDLENPPLLIVCDTDRIIIHTNFTNAPVSKYEITLADFSSRVNMDALWAVFHDPERLHPGRFREVLTTSAAADIAEVAQSLRDRRLDPHRVARFMDRVVFCMFAEDVGLLPETPFTRILERYGRQPAVLRDRMHSLFQSMAEGGYFGVDLIPHFNGDLFDHAEALELGNGEIERIRRASLLDWGAVDPSIFGTLFERGLDPDKRSQIGAHYTSRQDIETLIEPVVMEPLRREWEQVREQVEAILAAPRKKASDKQNAAHRADELIYDFLQRLGEVKVLDPACGSGNFLYVTLQKLKDFEREVIEYGLSLNLGGQFPVVGPAQLHGIEISEYAHDLARMTVWIGYLQWMHDNGYSLRNEPILGPAENIKCMDAIIDLSDPANPKDPEWPEVDFIVGNPPFLGDKLMRNGLGDEYVDRVRAFYADRLPGQSDLCCYWFEKARKQIDEERCKRAGLLATQGIRGGANREVLKRIKESGDIFFAESDRPWVLAGANVRVAMVGFDDASEHVRRLDGIAVQAIHANLTSGGSDAQPVTEARRIPGNVSLCHLGVMKAGAFDIPHERAARMLVMPSPNGRPNSDVLRLRVTAKDILQRTGGGWIIDFGCDATEESCAYELPWEHIVRHVQPERLTNRRRRLAEKWWLHGEPRPGLRQSLAGLPRFIVTPEVSKHRLFVWLDDVYLPDHQTRAFARSDDYFFGVLHSRIHEVWARAQGTQLRERESGFRYTPTTCFETFPFPEPTAEQEAAIAEAARELNELRENWLNPPEWTREEVLEFPGSTDGPWARYVHDPDGRGIGTVRYPRTVAKDPDRAALLAGRTLTNLYNERPTWLDQAHRKLDEAVFAAYGWDPSLSDDAMLEKLLGPNLSRAGASG